MRLVTVAFVLFLVILQRCAALTCSYSCSCDDCDHGVTQQKCVQDNDYCYSLKEESGSLSKGCASYEVAKVLCDIPNPIDCQTCQTDFCNSAINPYTKLPLVTFIVSLVLVVL